MSEFKSHRIKVASIPKGKSMCKVGNRSSANIMLSWLFTILIFAYTENKIAVIPFAIYALIVTFKPYKGIFEGYNSFFVIYDLDNKDQCDIYYLSELKYWSSTGTYFKPEITFFLNSGEKVVLKKAIDSAISEYLRKVAGKKEIRKKSNKK